VTESIDYLRTGAIDEALRDAKSKLTRVGDLQEMLASLVGTAESGDGRVRAESDSASGLRKLTIDPRAMRMGSEELAETITKVVADAIADLRRRSQEEIQKMMGGRKFDAEASKARVQEARASFERIAVDARGEMERLQRRIADAAQDSRRP
jgi:DNA-binding protein YbaB